MGGMSPGWTQTATERFRRGPKKRERRRVNPQEILAWLQLSQAVAQDKGIIGSVASRIQRSMRETELAEKRREARMDVYAETRRRRNEIAETVDPAVQAEMALMPAADVPSIAESMERARASEANLIRLFEEATDPAEKQRIFTTLQRVRQNLQGLEGLPPQPAPAPAPAPAAAPVEAAAVLQAAEVAPGVEMPAGLQDWRQIKPGDPVTFPPRADIAGAPEFPEAPEAPEVTTRPDWPQKVFTFMELMAQAREARTGEEFERVTAQLPEVIKVDPAMGGGSLSEIISGVSRRDYGPLRRDLMSAHVRGRKEKKDKDLAQAHLRRVKAWEIQQKIGHWQAYKEAQIAAANAKARIGSKDWNDISEFDRKNVGIYGMYISNPDDARLPDWLKGQPRPTAKGEMTKRATSKGKGLNTYLRSIQNIEASYVEQKMSPENRAQLAGLRTTMDTTRRGIVEMSIQGGLLKNVASWPHLNKQYGKLVQTLKKQQLQYRKMAKESGMAEKDIANMAAGFVEELGDMMPMPPKPADPGAPQ